MQDKDFLNQLSDLLNWKLFFFGIIGATAGVLFRVRMGILKSGWEAVYILFVGAFFSGFGTDPLFGWVEKKFPDFTQLQRIRDVMAVGVGIGGWMLMDLLIIEGPGLLKRWLSKQVEFVKDETSAKNDSDPTGKV